MATRAIKERLYTDVGNTVSYIRVSKLLLGHVCKLNGNASAQNVSVCISVCVCEPR